MAVKHIYNQGSALISALFIMTLVAIAATAMSTRLQFDIYRTHLTIASDKLYLASQAVTFWAMNTLSIKNQPFNFTDKEGQLLSFPAELQRVYPDVITKGGLYDMQALFNLNNLQDKKFHPLFFRLLENTLTKVNTEQNKLLLNAIYYWISPYQPERGHDESLNFYLKQNPVYLPGYQPMQSISELRLVEGVSAKTYQLLRPFVTTLPEITPININTSPKELLKSLGNGLNEEQVNELLQARGKKGFKNLQHISPLLQKLGIPNDQITIESEYYLSLATMTSEDLNFTIYTIIKRSKDKNGQISIGIINQSLNTN